MTYKFHTGQNSPFGCTEVLDNSVADSDLDSQMPPVADWFHPSGQKALKTGLAVGIGMNHSFAK